MQYPIQLERSATVPVMDNLIAQLEERLSNHQQTNLIIVLPLVMLKCDIVVFEKKLQEISIFDSS